MLLYTVNVCTCVPSVQGTKTIASPNTPAAPARSKIPRETVEKPHYVWYTLVAVGCRISGLVEWSDTRTGLRCSYHLSQLTVLFTQGRSSQGKKSYPAMLCSRCQRALR